jgi:hypothetical protein
MIKYIAIITTTGRGKVLNVPGFETRSTWAKEKAAGSIVLGEFSDKDVARRAMLLGVQGWRPMFERKQA